MTLPRMRLLHVVLFCPAVFLSIAAGCSTGGFRSVIPGPQKEGKTLLPNGWYLSPAGKGVQVGELPLNLAFSPDGSYVLSTDNGTASQGISVVDIAAWKTVQTLPVHASWVGLRFFDHGNRFIVSGGNDNLVRLYTFAGGRAALNDSIVVCDPWPKADAWLAGLDMDETDGKIFVAGMHNRKVYVLDVNRRSVVATVPLPAKPYTCLALHGRGRVYVSLWDGAAVVAVDEHSFRIVDSIGVGGHPNDMAASTDGKRLFVANANSNSVSVIDLDRGMVTETLSASLHPGDPEGSTTNSVALSADGKRLYAADADNNCLAVMDISTPGETRPLGFIPTGWYPTCVRILPGSGRIIVANGKGFESRANPEGPKPSRRASPDQYSGSMFRGTLSMIDPPLPGTLRAYTTEALANLPAADSSLYKGDSAAANPVPRNPGDPSPIKHIFYVIKENRTYDQVFGDLPEGNGDSSLCLFPEQVTPNLHELAREFVLLDNLYADAEVSADGHNWSMGAYATDYVEKTWPTEYGDRGGEYEYEGGTPAVYPSAGYLWDDCLRNGVTYRTYGEFAINGATPADSSLPTMESLRGHVAPHSRGWDLGYSDVDRIADWRKEFDRFDRDGGLPQFQIIKLPNDHTAGTRKGSLTPRAYVAQNDLAVGLLVERIARSRYWGECAIFIIEDDAQSGPDHVDAHRTEALVISPYTKRHYVDHRMYSTCSMIRTMELILGLPPLSQFDAVARPFSASFTAYPDFSPFHHVDSRIHLDERNAPGAFGQAESDRMDFSEEDEAPMQELNEILWKSVRGARSPMPPPVRAAWVSSLPR